MYYEVYLNVRKAGNKCKRKVDKKYSGIKQ
jgi:hypothetical protein